MNIHRSKIKKANKVLNATVTLWFVLAVLGQWIFAYYVATFYGGSAIHGNLENWNKVLPQGYVYGETTGNLAVAIHLFFAIIIIVGGPLQFSQQLRNRARNFHRWNGKIYIVTAIILSVSGLYMILTRGSAGGTTGAITISINAVLIIICAVLAWRFALKRNFKEHRIWTIRLFLVVSGVWFFRIGLMFWLFINNGPVGFDMKTFQGPFLTFLGIAQYALPLVVFEFYLGVQKRKNILAKYAVSFLLVALTILMLVGIFAATKNLWLPRV
ncbi:DUF2306 domain-containing protein [Pontimicrobium sp. SW4]|uniref:DUF2306 domain-containing protein n=1 Tax=Pontimicrobium sp. SW4 TaxID=3153519 RepID=A0AAU7BNY9_9FLAO